MNALYIDCCCVPVVVRFLHLKINEILDPIKNWENNSTILLYILLAEDHYANITRIYYGLASSTSQV